MRESVDKENDSLVDDVEVLETRVELTIVVRFVMVGNPVEAVDRP